MERTVKVGNIIGYVLDEGRYLGDIRPAIVVNVWSADCVQLQVFTDGDGGDYNDGLPNVMWKTSVTQDDDKASGTWHFLD